MGDLRFGIWIYVGQGRASLKQVHRRGIILVRSTKQYQAGSQIQVSLINFQAVFVPRGVLYVKEYFPYKLIQSLKNYGHFKAQFIGIFGTNPDLKLFCSNINQSNPCFVKSQSLKHYILFHIPLIQDLES